MLLAAALALDPRLGAVLDDPTHAFEGDRTPGGFRIVALSHLAAACVHPAKDDPKLLPEAQACTRKVVEAAQAIAPTTRLDDRNMLWTHLLLVLEACAEAHGRSCHPDDARLAAHLAARSLACPDGVAPSFPKDPGRWPADAAATMHALRLHDRHAGTQYFAATWPRARAAIVEGLPRSEMSGTKPHAELPRGSALAWTAWHVAWVEPDAAAALWQRAWASHGAGIGMREWPPGVDHPADIDSGPIIQGIGVAASAFSIGAARVNGDAARSVALASLAGMMMGAEPQNLLALSIYADARTTRVWD
jgi:hypothetical protein